MSSTDLVQEIYADLIDDPKQAMRSDMDRDALWELSQDIKQNGLINPITVRPVNDRFEVVAGHRRFTACKMAGKVRIACVVRSLTDAEVFNIKTSENLKRVDVDPVDEGMHFITAMETLAKSIPEIAEMVGRGEQYVKDRIQVALMPDYMREFLRAGQLKLGVALKLVQIEPDDKRKIWVDLAVRDGISVRTADYWLYQHNAGMLPDASGDMGALGAAPIAEYQAPMFECRVDGKKYPATDCTAVMVYKGNLSLLDALRAEVAKEPSGAGSPPPEIPAQAVA